MQSTAGRSASGVGFPGGAEDESLEALFAFFFFFLFFWTAGLLSRVGDGSVEETVGEDVKRSCWASWDRQHIGCPCTPSAAKFWMVIVDIVLRVCRASWCWSMPPRESGRSLPWHDIERFYLHFCTRHNLGTTCSLRRPTGSRSHFPRRTPSGTRKGRED
jgi:hypothetical protein